MKLKELLKDFMEYEVSLKSSGVLNFPKKKDSLSIRRKILTDMLTYKKVIDDLIIENHEMKKLIATLENKINSAHVIKIMGTGSKWTPLNIDPDIA